ncbi:MAG: ABC transporter substrate-binding protein [Pseudomonadales bacterium]
MRGALAVVCLLSCSVGLAAGPEAQLERLHAALLSVAREGDPTSARDEALLQPVVAEVFDFYAIARVVVGARWESFTKEEKESLKVRLQQLWVTRLLRRYRGVPGLRFIDLRAGKGSAGMEIEATEERTNAAPTRRLYRFRRNRIFDVVTEGRGELAVRRTEYGRLLREGGLEALLKGIDAEINGPALLHPGT